MIPIPLTSEEEAALYAKAEAYGVSVDFLLRRAVLHVISGEPRLPDADLSGEALERAFDQIADLIPDNVPAIPDEALSRESIYTRENDW